MTKKFKINEDRDLIPRSTFLGIGYYDIIDREILGSSENNFLRSVNKKYVVVSTTPRNKYMLLKRSRVTNNVWLLSYPGRLLNLYLCEKAMSKYFGDADELYVKFK